MSITYVTAQSTTYSLSISGETYIGSGNWAVDGEAAVATATGDTTFLLVGRIVAEGATGAYGYHAPSSNGRLVIDSGASIIAQTSAVRLGTSGADIINFGTLLVDPGSTPNLDRSTIYTEGNTYFENHGHLANLGLLPADPGHPSAYAYWSVGAAKRDHIVNTGTIIGHVYLGSGNDTFDNRGGSVTGMIQGGSGNDTYIIDRADLDIREVAGQGLDTVISSVSYRLRENFENLVLSGADNLNGRGNAENNQLTGNAGDNVLRGLEGADTFFWSTGSDTYRGGKGTDTADFTTLADSPGIVIDLGLTGWQAVGEDGDEVRLFGIENLTGSGGNDVLTGTDGNNQINGGAGDDDIRGKKGADLLIGESGDDTIKGGDGADTLIGGSGADVLTGGKGKDVFVYQSLGQSFDDDLDRDEITDFEVGKDMIDLAGVAADIGTPLIFITTGFTGTAGELRYAKNKGHVQIDEDGDGVADFVIWLSNKPAALSADDFILDF